MLSLSFVYVFGDTGSITVVSGKSYQINYDANYVQVTSVQPNQEDQGLVFSIQATSLSATLEITLPRELIDATKKDGSNDSFIVLVDGTFTSYVEKNSNQTSRTILIQLAPENKELEIIGTSLAGSGIGSAGTTQTPTTQSQIPTPQQTNQTQQTQNNTSLQQNQTSTPIQKPTEISSEKPKINLPFNITGNLIIEYSIIASVILILIIVIASSKSKARKQIQK
jgi:hypothetical protein